MVTDMLIFLSRSWIIETVCLNWKTKILSVMIFLEFRNYAYEWAWRMSSKTCHQSQMTHGLTIIYWFVYLILSMFEDACLLFQLNFVYCVYFSASWGFDSQGLATCGLFGHKSIPGQTLLNTSCKTGTDVSMIFSCRFIFFLCFQRVLYLHLPIFSPNSCTVFSLI